MKFTGERMIPEFNQGGEIFLEHINRYIFASQFSKNKVVLDIACGSGYGSDLLLKSGAKQVFGVDISKEAVGYCIEKYSHKNLSFLVGDVRNVPIENNKIDLLVSFETIEHVNEEDQKIFINEIRRVLKPGGILLMSTPNISAFRAERENDFHLKELTVSEYRNILHSKFKFNKIYYQDSLESNYILNKEETTNVNYFLNGNVNTSKIEALKTKDAVFFVSVSSNNPLPEIKGNVSLHNKNEKNNIIKHLNNLGLKEIKNKIRKKNIKISKLNQDLLKTKKLLCEREAELNLIKDSKFWKMRDRYLRIKYFRPKHAVGILKKGIFILKKDGIVALSKEVRDYVLHGRGKLKILSLNNGLEITDYEKWIHKNEEINIDLLNQEVKSFKYSPRVSIIFPVFNANEIFLRKAIFSVIYQCYDNWELCIIDNASTSKICKKILEDFQKRDPQRIKVIYLNKKEEISTITNRAAEMASGEFVGFLSHEDILSRNALCEHIKLLNKNPNLDLIYSDEDRIDEDLFRFSPSFKPDWSPELLLSYNYIGRFKVVRKKLFFELGKYHNRFGNFQDYDFLLRLSEKTDRIGHISKILFHNALLPGSTSDPKEPKYIEKGKQALSEALERRKIKARAIIPDFAQKANLGIYKIRFSANDYNEKVTIIIPTKDKADLLKRCIKSIKEKTNYKNYDILVIDNNSKERKTFNYLANKKINYTSIPTKSFNFALINNLAVRKVKTELILFLNNDTEVISPDWLTEMVGTISLDKKIAAVGAKLIYDDKRVQHAGVIVGLSMSTASHANKMLDFNNPGYQYYNLVMRNYSAVTAACMLTRKSLFQKIGGFDEKNHAVFCNDVDYCLKLINSDYRVVYNPDALLYHHESKSRGFKDNIKEVEHFRKKWINIIKKDPFYNINLSLENERFEIKKY